MKKIAIIFFWVLFFYPVLFAQDKAMTEGQAAYLRGDYQRAAMLFSEVIQKDPEAAEAWLWRGKALFAAGEEEAALTVFRQADKLRPGYGSLWQARIYAARGDYDRAFAALEKHLASSWHRPLREILLDTLLTPLEDDPRWRAIWKKEWYSRREQAVDAVRGDLMLEDYDAALHDAGVILAQYNNDPTLLALQARALLGKGDLRAAGDVLEKALEADPADTSVLLTSVMLAGAKDDYAAMARGYEKLYKKRPGDFGLLMEASDAWLQAGEKEKALTLVEKYRTFFPDDTRAMLLAGELYAAKGDYRNALRLLSKVVEKEPGDPYSFVTRGDVYMKAHTYRYAIYDYGMALDLDPANGDVYYRRGEAYLKTGDRKSACFDFDRALHYGKKKAILYLQKYCGK
jgi:tetratricopeptide (TPR) repeat protein